MITLGSVNFNLGADTTGLSASIQQMQRFGRVVDATQTRVVEGAGNIERAMRRQEKATVDAANSTLKLIQTMSRVDGAGRYAQGASDAFKRLNDYMTSGTRSMIDYQRAMQRFKTEQGNVVRGFMDHAAQSQTAARSTGLFANAMRTLQSSSVLITGPLGGVATRISTIGALANTTGAAWALFAGTLAGTVYVIYKMSKAMLDAGVAMQRFRSQLVTVTDDMPQAVGMFEKISAIADRTGQRIDTLVPSFARFTLAANDTGLTMKQVEEMFGAVSAAATKLQLSQEESAGIFRALEQMMSKGTVQAEELRGQLGDRLPGAFNIMARALGVSTAKLNEMMKAGEVLSAEALPKFTRELMRTLNIDASERIDNWTASVNRLSNAWFELMNTMNEMTGTSDIVKFSMDAITATFKALDQALKAMPAAFGRLGIQFQKLWAFVVASTKQATEELMNVLINMAQAIPKVFVAIPFVIGEALVDGFNNVITGLNDFMKKFDEAITSHIGPHSPIWTDMGKIANPFEGSISTAIDEITKQFKVQHDVMGDVLGDYHAYLEAIERARKHAEFMRASERKDRENGAFGIPYEIPGAGKQPGLEMTEKQIKALERQKEALKAINDEIERTNEEIAALGGSEATLDSLSEKFKRDQEVEKYAKALRKAGVETSVLTMKTQELAAALEQRDALMHAREAMLELRDSMVDAFDTITDSVLNAFEQGENAAEAFKKAVVRAINQIIDEMLKLLIFNPLKNWLFGTNLPTFESVGAMGGALGQIFGGGKAAAPFAAGGPSTFLDVIGANQVGRPGGQPPQSLAGLGSPLVQAVSHGIESSLSGSFDKWASAIRFVESGSYGGNYSALGPITSSGDRAYGAYQVMGNNVGPWTAQHFGTRLTPMQFLGNQSAQDAVFKGEFGGYTQKYGIEGAVRKWFTGSPTGTGSDGYNTADQYVTKFNKALENAPGAVDKMTTSATNAANGMQNAGVASAKAAAGMGNMAEGMSKFGANLSSFLSSAQGGGSGWFQGLSGMFGGASGALDYMWGISPMVTNFILGGGVGLFSGGGDVSSPKQRSTRFNPLAWLNAPHFAGGGFVGDEVPIVAHRGERVLSKDEARRGVGGGTTINNIVYNNSSASVRQEQKPNNQGGYDLITIIDDLVAERMSRQGSMTDKAIRRRYGLRPTLESR